MQALKKLLGPFWLLFIAAWYFKYHSYYASSIAFTGSTLLIVGVWVLGFVGLWGWLFLRRKGKWILTPVQGLIFFLVLTWLTGIVLYTRLDPAVLQEPTQLFFEGENIAAVEEGVRVEGDILPDLKRGDIITDWHGLTDFLPVELQAWFVVKPLTAFALDLGKNLVVMAGFWALFLMFFSMLGTMALRRRSLDTLVFFESVGVGMAIAMAAMFTLGTFGILNEKTIWAVFVGLFLLGGFKAKVVWEWVRTLRLEISLKSFKWLAVFSLLFLGLFLSLNVLELLHPFPTGYDSLHVYHNTPRLLLQYGHLISGLSSGGLFAYNIELLLTFVLGLFGTPLFGMGLIFLANLLAFALLFTLLHKIFDRGESAFLTLVLVSLPMVNFMLRIDLKFDLALLFFTLLAGHRVVRWWSSRKEKTAIHEAAWIGFWLGIAFGIKYTTLLVIVTVFAVYSMAAVGTGLAMAIGLIGLGILGFMKMLFFLDGQTFLVQGIVAGGLIVIGFAMAVASFWKGKKWQLVPWKTYVVTAGTTLLVFIPWLIFFGSQAETFNLYTVLYGSRSGQTFAEGLTPIEGQACLDVSNYREIERYTGGFEGNALWTPLVILLESTLNSNFENNLLTDISFLFLGFFVWLLIDHRRWMAQHAWLKPLAFFTVFYGILWLLTGRGIIWYGLPMLIGLLFLYGRLWHANRWAQGLVVLWVILSFWVRSYNTLTSSEAVLAAGSVTDKTLYMEQMESGMSTLVGLVNAPELKDQRIYLVGGGMSTYFIEQNDRRVISDPFLNDFECYLNSENPEETLKRLREMDIAMVVFSKGNLPVESDPNGPLHQQFERFELFAVNHLVEEYYTQDMIVYRVPTP